MQSSWFPINMKRLQNKKFTSIMELLIPAGNNKHVELALKLAQTLCMVASRKFNARNKAINFSVEDYNESVEILHGEKILNFI